ncbi:unnamed protein product, partial [Discosporangium mesarthrocarpum]
DHDGESGEGGQEAEGAASPSPKSGGEGGDALLKPAPCAPIRGTFWDEEDQELYGSSGGSNSNSAGRLKDDSIHSFFSASQGFSPGLALSDSSSKRRALDFAGHSSVNPLGSGQYPPREIGQDNGSKVGSNSEMGEKNTAKADNTETRAGKHSTRPRYLNQSAYGEGGTHSPAAVTLFLPDQGLGRLAMPSHTKSTTNRRNFFGVFRRVARQMEVVDDTSSLAAEGHTPRQDFLRKLLEMGRLPYPVLLRDPSRPKELDLGHKGLGDDFIQATAEVLSRLPEVESLNVADNRLTDRSLEPLCRLVVEMPCLRCLDLSANKVDMAAATIREYLVHRTCSLETLVLRQADLDDSECCELMLAVARNRSLTHLNLSGNKIGETESLNVVQPDTITGGEAIGDMLADNHTLKFLDVSWNNIRMESATAIGRSLAENQGLESLNLAHNAFGEIASGELGYSLRSNSALKSLDMSFNGVTPPSTMVIANACKANNTLTELNLDGNRLGRKGSVALMSAIRKRKVGFGPDGPSFLILSLSNCDVDSDTPDLFDPSQPTGEYRLDVSLPYSRMVVSELVERAETKTGYEFDAVFWAKDKDALDNPDKREKVKIGHEGNPKWEIDRQVEPLVREILQITSHSHLATQTGDCVVSAGWNQGEYEYRRLNTIAEDLLHLLGLSPEPGVVLQALDKVDWSVPLEKGIMGPFAAIFRGAFRVYDKDRSGALDWKELQAVLQGLGYPITDKRCQALVSVFDFDDSGSIEEDEFISWMAQECVKEPERPKGRILDLTTGYPWKVPLQGNLLIDFTGVHFPHQTRNVEDEGGLAGLIHNIERVHSPSDKMKMFENAIFGTDVVLTAAQAEILAAIVGLHQDPVATAEKLLPQILNAEQRARFLEAHLDAQQRLRLAIRMKYVFRAVMGNPTGLYVLDMREASGRLAATKLAEIANQEVLLAKKAGRATTSQKGNRTPFRNEVVGGHPAVLSNEWFTRVPTNGLLRMDFVSTARPKVAVQAISAARLHALKRTIGGEEMKEIREAYDEYDKLYSPHNLPDGHVLVAQDATTSVPAGDSESVPYVNGGPQLLYFTLCCSPDPSRKDAQQNPSDRAAGEVLGGSGNERGLRGMGGGRWGKDSGAEGSDGISYFPDLDSVFKRRCGEEPRLPQCKVPDCVNGRMTAKDWYDFRFSSHMQFDYFDPHRKWHRPMGKVGAKRGVDRWALRMLGRSHMSTETTGAVPVDKVGYTSSLGEKAEVGAVAVAGGGAGSGEVGGLAPTKLYRFLYHRLMLLQTAACAAWYTCAQVTELGDMFPWQDFGRVQAIISVFSRIINIEDFSTVVFNRLRKEEQRELIHRLGILNVLTPLDPDREYELDLRCWESREWAKVLIRLAVEEPGDNWVGETYTHRRGVMRVWGWRLPDTWTKGGFDAGGEGDGAGRVGGDINSVGPRKSGLLCLRYTTDPEVGCEARWDVRRALQSRTLAGAPREE